MKTDHGSLAYLSLACLVAALGGLLFGFDTAVINGAIVFLKRQFALSDSQTEIGASSLLLGCVSRSGNQGTQPGGDRELVAGPARRGTRETSSGFDFGNEINTRLRRECNFAVARSLSSTIVRGRPM